MKPTLEELGVIERWLSQASGTYAHRFVNSLNRLRYARRYLHVKRLDWSLTPTVNDLKVLDVGAGGLFDALLFGMQGAWVVAIDPSKELISSGKKMVLKEAMEKHVFAVVGDATRLPVKSEHFDIVVSYSGIEHVSGRSTQIDWISEMVRVLKRGGTFVLTTTNRLNIPVAVLAWVLSRLSTSYYETSFLPGTIRGLIEEQGVVISRFDGNTFFYYGYLGFTTIGYLVDRCINILESVPGLGQFGARIGFVGQRMYETGQQSTTAFRVFEVACGEA